MGNSKTHGGWGQGGGSTPVWVGMATPRSRLREIANVLGTAIVVEGRDVLRPMLEMMQRSALVRLGRTPR